MHGVENQIEPLKTQVVKADMFIAFSKKSPCLALIGGFGRKVGAMRANGVIDNMLQNAIKVWDSSRR